MTRYRHQPENEYVSTYDLGEMAQFSWLKRSFLTVYRLLDLATNIRATQFAISRIPAGWPLFAAFIFIGAMDIFAWLVLYYVDFLPSLTYGRWFAGAVGAAGAIAAVMAYAFALVPTGSEIIGPMLGASVWFMNRITEISIVFDAITDEPTISAMVDARVTGVVFVNDFWTPVIVVIVKFVFLVLSSLVVQHVAICMLVAQIEIVKRTMGNAVGGVFDRLGGQHA